MADADLSRSNRARKTPESKLCRSCQQVRPASEYYLIKSRWLSALCRECTKAAVKAYRSANVEYYKAYDKARANDPRRVEMRRKYKETEAGREALTRGKKKYIIQNPDKRRAHIALNNPVRRRLISKPTECQNCGACGSIHGHHHDYSKPLEVTWLCVQCHARLHVEHRNV